MDGVGSIDVLLLDHIEGVPGVVLVHGLIVGIGEGQPPLLSVGRSGEQEVVSDLELKEVANDLCRFSRSASECLELVQKVGVGDEVLGEGHRVVRVVEDDPQLYGVEAGEIDGVCCRLEAQILDVGCGSDGYDSIHWQLLDSDLKPDVFSIGCEQFFGYLDSIRTFEFNTTTVLTGLVHQCEIVSSYSQVEDVIAGLRIPFDGPRGIVPEFVLGIFLDCYIGLGWNILGVEVHGFDGEIIIQLHEFVDFYFKLVFASERVVGLLDLDLELVGHSCLVIEVGTAEHGVQVLLGASVVVRSNILGIRILSFDRGGSRDGDCRGIGCDPDHTGHVGHGGPELPTGRVFGHYGGFGLQDLDLDRLCHSLEDLILGGCLELDIVLSCIDDLLHGLHVAPLIFYVEDGLEPVRGDRYGFITIDSVVDIEGELVLEIVTGVCRIGSGGDGDEFGREIGLDDLEVSVNEDVPGLRGRLLCILSGICERDLGYHGVRIEPRIDDIDFIFQSRAIGDRLDPERFLRNKGDDLCSSILEPLLIDDLAIPLDRDIADTEVHILFGTEVLHPYLVEEALFELVVGIDEEEEVLPRILIAIYHDARILDMNEPSHVLGFVLLSKVDAFLVGEIENSTVLHLSALLNQDLPFNPYRAVDGVHELRTGQDVNNDILGDK